MKKNFTRFNYLKAYALMLGLFMLLLPSSAWGQTTVFSDDMSTNTSATYTTSGLIGASVWTVSRAAADFGGRRNTSPAQLELTNDASGTTNVAGWVLASTPSSSFTSPYNTTLSSNLSLVTWTFNMQQIRTDPAGFGVGSYGVAFILAGTSTTNNNTGSGYAIVLGQSGSTDPVRLVRYSGGIQGTMNNIITSNTTGLTDFGAEYLSIKVIYIPSSNTWELFLRNDGASTFVDPATGTLVSQGTAVDNTHTGTTLPLMGAWWQASTTTNQAAFFDNVKVTVNCPTITATFTGATTICTGASTSLSVAVTGGTSPYTLTLDNSGGMATSATPVSKSVSPTTNTAYTATVADANGCAATVSGNTQTVTVNTNALSTGSWSAGGTWSCGIAPTTTTNVTIPTGVNITLDVDATINNLTFTGGGKLTLGSKNITVNGTVTGGASAGYVVTDGTGKLTLNAVGTATFPIGPTASAYNPVTIAAGGGFNYAVNVSATAPTGTGVAQPSAAISRQWDISPNGAPTNVSLTFQYNSGEGVTDAFSPTGSLDGMHFNGTRWDYIGNSTGTGASPYMVAFTYAGPTWSPFSFGNAGILPTELTALKAKAQKGQNLLIWQTVTEKNSDHFDIQRSSSTQANWQTISTVKAAGNSQTLKAYQFVDDAPLSISYYRLRQVDFDGKESLSNTVSVISSVSGKLKIYPTIVQDKLTISLDSNEPQTFNIYNLLGQNVQTGQLTGQKELIISQLSTGTYFLKAHGETVKFVKN